MLVYLTSSHRLGLDVTHHIMCNICAIFLHFSSSTLSSNLCRVWKPSLLLSGEVLVSSPPSARIQHRWLCPTMYGLMSLIHPQITCHNKYSFAHLLTFFFRSFPGISRRDLPTLNYMPGNCLASALIYVSLLITMHFSCIKHWRYSFLAWHLASVFCLSVQLGAFHILKMWSLAHYIICWTKQTEELNFLGTSRVERIGLRLK